MAVGDRDIETGGKKPYYLLFYLMRLSNLEILLVSSCFFFFAFFSAITLTRTLFTYITPWKSAGVLFMNNT